MMMAGVFKV